VYVIFGQVQHVNGWDFSATLALLGVYLTVLALRGLFIGPGLEALAGMDGEIWSGKFDFTVLRPLNIQFLVSLRKWRCFRVRSAGVGNLGAAWRSRA
jgi:ABC-2 type transport system permease protein